MPAGAPPPWLINMQRYGPPPSYPNLKIPGLNAPIPPGAQFGYHPGGWGKPPVDELGRPLYGDVFGTAQPEPPPEISQPIDRKRWGEIEPEEEEEEESEEEVEEKDNEPVDESGLASVSEGIETPDVIDIRKSTKPAIREEKEDEPPKQLYQVIETTSTAVGGALYGSGHKYVMPGTEKQKEKTDDMDTSDFTQELHAKALEREKAKEAEEQKKKEKEKKGKKYDFKF